jgi:hypothetical protein
MSTSPTIVLDNPAQINAFRAHTLRIGLAPSCYTIIKRELGFKGNKIRVYAQYVLWMGEKGLLDITPTDRATLMAWAVKN